MEGSRRGSGEASCTPSSCSPWLWCRSSSGGFQDVADDEGIVMKSGPVSTYFMPCHDMPSQPGGKGDAVATDRASKDYNSTTNTYFLSLTSA
jgi:hypothetical protein